MEANASTTLTYSKMYLFSLDLTTVKVYGNDLSVDYTNSTDSAIPGGSLLSMKIIAIDLYGNPIGSCTVNAAKGIAVIENGAKATRLSVIFNKGKDVLFNAMSVPMLKGLWLGNYTVGISKVSQNGASLTVEYFNSNGVNAKISAFDSNRNPLGTANANSSQGIAKIQLPNSGSPEYLVFSVNDEKSPCLVAYKV